MKYAFAIITLVLGVVIINQYRDATQQLGTSKHEYVQTVCDIAHDEYSGESEQKCGDAQDQTNTEYLCNHSGTTCWVEDK